MPKLNISNLVGQIKEYLRPKKSVAEMADQKMSPSGTDIGLRHRTVDAGIHIRDDGVVEINSGSTCMTLDGKTGTVYTSGARIISSAKDIIDLAKPGGHGLDNAYLNPRWLPSWLPVDPLFYRKQVLTQIFPGALSTVVLTEVPGSPAPVPIPLSTLFEPVLIYKKRNPAERIASTLNTLIQEVMV